MLQDTGGIPVRLGPALTYGHFDDGAADTGLEIEVVIEGPSVVVATKKLPDIAMGAVINVDGKDWKVRDHRREADGGLTRVFLET